MDKAAWRTKLRARRAALDDGQRRAAEVRMVELFDRLPATGGGGRVLVYVAVPPEAPTAALTESLWRRGASVYAPRLDRARPGEMDVVPFARWDELVPGPYFDIPQPPFDVPAVPPDTLDVVVVPGVGFDTLGRRIGQAGGYYDRLLARLPRRIVRVGWAFAVQFVEQLPEEPHDQRVDLLVTEDGVTRFAR